MSSIGAIHPSPVQLSRAREASAWVAVEALRCLAPDSATFGMAYGSPAGARRARQAFAIFLVAARTTPGARAPHMAQPGSLAMTKDERRLLRALAAARAGDEVLLDNYIYRFALDLTVRAWLAASLRALAHTPT